jgi:N-methylhydantoinase B
MNNLTFGGEFPASWPSAASHFAYYETIGGGGGAVTAGDGANGIHVHMSNTRNTPIEALEHAFPVRVTKYSLREGSGGAGRHRGGEGLIRELEFLTAVDATITAERRRRGPYGLHGGGDGAPGRNTLVRDGEEQELPGKVNLRLDTGDRLRLETPGGGGWGEPE